MNFKCWCPDRGETIQDAGTFGRFNMASDAAERFARGLYRDMRFYSFDDGIKVCVAECGDVLGPTQTFRVIIAILALEEIVTQRQDGGRLPILDIIRGSVRPLVEETKAARKRIKELEAAVAAPESCWEHVDNYCYGWCTTCRQGKDGAELRAAAMKGGSR